MGTSVRVIAALTVSLVICACVGPFSELQERQYANSAAAKSGDPSGWIPEILTDDATSIHEVPNIASNEAWGGFRTGQPVEFVCC